MVIFVDIVVDKKSLISNPGPEGKEGEEQKGKEGFPGFDNFPRVGDNDKVKPNVGENRPGGGNKKHPQMFDFSGFIMISNIL